MTAKPKVEFDRDRADGYNLDIRKAIPGYEALHGMAQSILASNLPTAASVLVVGSGTGMELISYARQHSQWSLTGVDPSPEMMAIAKSKLKNEKLLSRVSLHTGYTDTLSQTKLMDAATLMLVMHFVNDDDSKLSLLRDIAKHLKPGAEFILADLHGDKSRPYFAKLKTAWQNFYFSQLDDTARAKAEQNFAATIDNSIYFVSETRIKELLNAAGFSNVTKFYNAFLFGGWTAKYTG